MEIRIKVVMKNNKAIDLQVPISDAWLYADQKQVIIETMDKVIDMMLINHSTEENDEG